MTFWTLAVTLTLNTAVQPFHKTLCLVMKYRQAKFGSSGLAAQNRQQKQSYFDYMGPHCDLNLEDSKPIFGMSASLYQFWTFAVTLINLRCDLEVEHRNPIFALDIPPCDDLPPTKLQKNHQFRRCSRQSYCDHPSAHSERDLEDSN